MTVLDEIAAERRRLIEKDFDQAHDDEHSYQEPSAAAAGYASAAAEVVYGPPPGWPWEREAFQPEGPRANMLKALALCVAAIERMDREHARLFPPMKVPEHS